MNVPAQVTPRSIGLEWDRVASERFSQIASGRDRSYLFTLCPYFEESELIDSRTTVLDVGCGVGYLTDRLAKKGANVVGIDLSARSIEIAKANYHAQRFIVGDAVDHDLGEFDVVTANMVLMDYPYLERLIGKLSKTLRVGGSLLATIPNPYIWPRYWRYEGKGWFNYFRETPVKTEFSTSSAGSLGETTHFHRPLAAYLNASISRGLQLKALTELTGNAIERRLLRKYPRYVAFHFVRT